MRKRHWLDIRKSTNKDKSEDDDASGDAACKEMVILEEEEALALRRSYVEWLHYHLLYARSDLSPPPPPPPNSIHVCASTGVGAAT